MRLAAIAVLLALAGCASYPDCPEVVCPVVQCEPCVQRECPAEQDCPAITVTKNYTFTRYVCPDGRVEADSLLCAPSSLTTSLVASTASEANTSIASVAVEPARVYGQNGGLVDFKLQGVARDIVVQVRTENRSYWDVYSASALREGKRLFILGPKQEQADFRLDRNQVYLLRVRFNISSKIEYSNEHLVDSRYGSDYSTKQCS